MTTRTRFVIILITAPILAFVVVGGLLARTRPRDEAYPHLRVFEDVFSLTTSAYVESVDSTRLMHGAMHGLAEALDADSAYLTPEQVRLADASSTAAAADVGLVLTRQYYLRIVAVWPDSPAARAGLRTGDYVRVIDRKPTRDMSAWEGTRLLRGAAGSTVTLTVLRGNAIDPHVVTLTRERLTLPAATATMRDGGVGWIRLVGLTDQTPNQLRERIAQLQRDGARALVLDLRDCATGALPAGLATARLFVATGALGHLDARNAPRETLSASAGDGECTMPMVVLVTSGTSGAAELLAAALRGNKRADVVGERTAGRTAVQKLFPLPDGSALWMSYAQYRGATGEVLHERGLQPDVMVEQPDIEFGAAPLAADPIMERALERLRTRSGS